MRQFRKSAIYSSVRASVRPFFSLFSLEPLCPWISWNLSQNFLKLLYILIFWIQWYSHTKIILFINEKQTLVKSWYLFHFCLAFPYVFNVLINFFRLISWNVHFFFECKKSSKFGCASRYSICFAVFFIYSLGFEFRITNSISMSSRFFHFFYFIMRHFFYTINMPWKNFFRSTRNWKV